MKKPSDTAIARAEAVFRDHGGTMTTSAALAAGIEERTLYWMRDSGLVEALSRGLYHLSTEPFPEQPDIYPVMRKAPRAVLCLISALYFHDIGTQIPHAVQIALPTGVKGPRIEWPQVQVFHMSEESFSAGIEEHEVDGQRIRVYGIAKTVADCFKFRNKIGQDIAVEALQEVVRSRRSTPAEIMHFAAIDRVSRIVRPYLEALVS